jgi:hypothetical protein
MPPRCGRIEINLVCLDIPEANDSVPDIKFGDKQYVQVVPL